SSNCASASLVAGFAFRSSSRRRLACLRSQPRFGASGSESADPGSRSAMRHLLSFERGWPFHAAPLSAIGARNRRLCKNGGGWVEPFTRTVGRPHGAGFNSNGIVQARLEMTIVGTGELDRLFPLIDLLANFLKGHIDLRNTEKFVCERR